MISRFTIATVALGFAVALTNAIPSMDFDYAPHSRAMRYGIQGADSIRAMAISYRPMPDMKKPWLTSAARAGEPGVAVVGDTEDPPTFFIKAGRLMQYVNQTSVVFVNVVDPWKLPAGATPPSQPARAGYANIELDTKPAGIEGEWFFVNQNLHFATSKLPPPLMSGQRASPGQRVIEKNGKPIPIQGQSNEGVYFACHVVNGALKNGNTGHALYMDFEGYNFARRRTPDGCDPFTLHSLGVHAQ